MIVQHNPVLMVVFVQIKSMDTNAAVQMDMLVSTVKQVSVLGIRCSSRINTVTQLNDVS